MIKSSSLSGGKTSSSSKNTFAKSNTTKRFYNLSASHFSFSDNMAYNLHPLHILFYNCREERNLKDTPQFLPTITLLCPKSSIKLNRFVLRSSMASCDSNQSMPITMS
jgi:hypothetical protein